MSATESVLEKAGAITQGIGAVLMSLNVTYSPWAYALWLPASAVMLYVAVRRQASANFFMYSVFVATNTVGAARWLF